MYKLSPKTTATKYLNYRAIGIKKFWHTDPNDQNPRENMLQRFFNLECELTVCPSVSVYTSVSVYRPTSPVPRKSRIIVYLYEPPYSALHC